MKFHQVLKEIEKHTWWSEDAPATIQTVVTLFHCFLRQHDVISAKLLTKMFVGMKGDFLYERTPEDEKLRTYKICFNRMKKDPDFIDKCRTDFNKRLKQVFREGDKFIKNRTSMTDQELGKSYKKFTSDYVNNLSFAATIEGVDIFTAYHLEDEVKKEIGVSDVKVRDIISTLSLFTELSFMEKERLNFLRFSLKHFKDIRSKNKTSALMRDLEKHSDLFSHSLNNFKNIIYLDTQFFLKKTQQEIKRGKTELKKEYDSLRTKITKLKIKQEKIYALYDFSDDLKLHFKMIRALGYSADNRKSNLIKANEYLKFYCDEISRRLGIGWDDLKLYTFTELSDFLLKGFRLTKNELKKRSDLVVIVLNLEGKRDVKETMFYGKQAEEILRRTAHQSDSDELEGQIASAPVESLRGRVKIVLDVYETKFKKGEILVTTMTRPEFVPLMRKASAIITEEGGLTCHAAILSRELQVPCIIGTKVATRLLRDGDLVEMDMKKGIVRKIK